MVTVKNFKTITGSDGKDFYALVVEGEAHPVLSEKTNSIYFTTRTATVPCTFDEATCRELIGTKFSGDVVKVDCEPYEYTLKDTNETIVLSYRWRFTNEKLQKIVEHMINETEKIL